MPRFESRRTKLRSRLRKTGAEALLVTNFTNVTYLTGFTGDSSYLLLMRKGETLLTDRRYTTQLEEECPDLELEVRGPKLSMPKLLARVLGRAKLSSLAIENGSMTVGLYRQLESTLPGVELVGTDGLVEELRAVKDRQEIAAICRAVRQAERGFEVIRSAITLDQSEKQIAADLESQLRRFGAEGFSFTPIVGVGPRSALPHGRPSTRRIGESDFTLIDWGAREGLYVSDLTRMVVTGKISPKLRKVYGVVLKAHQAGIRAIRPGVACEEVDEAARKVIAQAGYGSRFGHSLGHGIGLEVHEAPRLAGGSKTTLRPGMVVTVEPGVYLPGWGGIRIEDDVLVIRDGHEVLSTLPHELEHYVVS